jgi:hypothetical protein
MELLLEIFEVCIIPLLGTLTIFLIKWINAKSAQLQTTVDNETLKKYIGMLDSTITSCVLTTTQTYVESLKKQGQFDAEAQKIAFQQTKDAVLVILSDEAKEYLTAALGDLDTYINTKIEAEVNLNK